MWEGRKTGKTVLRPFLLLTVAKATQPRRRILQNRVKKVLCPGEFLPLILVQDSGCCGE